MTVPDLALIVHTRQSTATLPQLLATTSWISERIVIDMQSDDGTPAMAEAAGCRVISIAPTPVVDEVRNVYLSETSREWTLVLDSDEYLAADAPDEISRLIETAPATIDAFAIPRFNIIAGQVMKGAAWYPDAQPRLFRTGRVRWGTGHHAMPEPVGGLERLLTLTPPDCLHIHHANYSTVTALIERQLQYALTDNYDAPFDFSDYLRQAYEEFARRHDVESVGELGTALAIVMSWDRIIRGLIHWERSGRVRDLETAFTIPVVPAFDRVGEVARLQQEIAALRGSASYRITAPLRAALTSWRRLRSLGRKSP